MATGGSSGGSARGVRAGGAFVELGVKDRISQALRGIQAKFLSFGKLIATGGAAGAAAGGGLLAAAVPTLGDLSKLDATAKAFGLTAEKASGLFGVMEASGSDIRDATEGLVTLGQRVTDAMSGTGEDAKKLFDGLGVSAANFAGLDPADQFFKLHAALREVQDPAQRVQLLLKAVGEDTGKNLIGTLSMTTDELREQAAGFAMTGDELKAASQATAAYNRASATIGSVWKRVAVAVAPLIEKAANWLTKFLDPLKNLGGWWELQSAKFQLGWANTVLALTDGWNQFKDFFVDGWHDAVYLVENIWNDLTAWMGKTFVDVMAFVRKEFGATIHKMIAVLDALPGGFIGAFVLRGVRDAMNSFGDPEKTKAGLESLRQAEENRLNKAKQAADEARRLARAQDMEAARADVIAAEKRLAEIKARLAVVNREEGVAGLNKKATEAISAAAGVLGFGSGGFLAQAFGARSVSPQVMEQKKANVLLEQIRNAVVRAPGLVWG